MRPKLTQRGFLLVEFKDRYDADCSIQESSIVADEENGACIWFGTHRDRMHLSQAQVKELLPILTHFAEFGGLPFEPEDAIQTTHTNLTDEPHAEPDPRELEKAARATAQFIRSYSPDSAFARFQASLYELFQKYADGLEKALGDIPERPQS